MGNDAKLGRFFWGERRLVVVRMELPCTPYREQQVHGVKCRKGDADAGEECRVIELEQRVRRVFHPADADDEPPPIVGAHPAIQHVIARQLTP